MSRLYETKADEKRWKIVEIDKENYNSYKLIDKENEEIYFLNHIIGFEQVTDDEFLVFRRANYDDFEIVRYKLQKSKFIKLFSERFSQFYFISDDRIMFTYWGNTGRYRCGGIYSIKDNSMLKEANWLEGTIIDIYKDDENPDEIKLYVEKEIYSYRLNNQKLIFTVDPNTLLPNSDCYSQLRDSFIKVSSKEDIDKIESEEQKNIKIIEEQMYQKEKEQLQKAKQKVLGRKKESK
ncbi:MAG: hypothetical protein VZS44_01435 [Bacilli bacterium]|nr:hypothetical protein [Bacilli bacterium]